MIENGINQGFLLAQMLNFGCVAAFIVIPVAAVIFFVRRKRPAPLPKHTADTQPVRLQDSGHQLTAPLHLEQAGRYAFQVAPADDSASWVLEISPLGLPGKKEP